MYIFKNALKCISRSKGRNILIGIIALVIAVSACIGLSIRQAAESAKTDTLDGMTVTGTISFDRGSLMNNMGKPDEDGGLGKKGGFDRTQFAEMMGEASALTLEEYQTYAQAESVDDFYYTLNAYFDGSDNLEPVSTDTDTDSEETTDTKIGGGDNPEFNQGFGGMDKMGGMMSNMMGGTFNSGDFTVIGYSSETAMTAFLDGSASITDGVVFTEGSSDYDCIISEELAIYNDLEVGSTITLTNSSSETETYALTVVGIYTSSASNEFSGPMFSVGQDPANRIYMSSVALQSILDASESVSKTVTDEDTGREYETAVTGTLAATYVFADADAYYQFEEDVRTLGLDDSYTVSSADITSFENSLIPLETLSTMAGWFLLVILIIGAVILIVLNIFNVRERKYEIGVLTAMGMKKGKVALQFITEILIVTMIAVVIGAGIGAVSSVPVTNVLLKNQITSQQTQHNRIENNFGRPGDMQGEMNFGEKPSDMNDGNESFEENGTNKGANRFERFGQNMANYITEVDSAMNLTVVLQMLGIGLLLTLVAGAVSVLFVMRYNPLKILANRD